jgi:hypothetical protein
MSPEGEPEAPAAAEAAAGAPPPVSPDEDEPEAQLDLVANPFQVDVEGGENTQAQQEPARLAVSAKTIETRQETVRGRLAQWLVLASIVLVAFLAVALAANWLNSDELKTSVAVLLSPLVALTGSAAGFYFGGKR